MARVSNIMMYGLPPIDQGPRDPWVIPESPLPFEPFTPAIRPVQPISELQGMVSTKDSIVQSLIARIDYLRKKLEDVDAMREELATLERMLAATRLEPT